MLLCSRLKSLDFFWDQKHANYAVARDFTATSSYSPFGGVSPKKNRLYGKLNEQITHLTYGRTDDPAAKIGPQERAAVKELIEKEIDNFSSHIDAPYQRLWKPRGEVLPNHPMIPGTTTIPSTVTSIGPFTGRTS